MNKIKYIELKITIFFCLGGNPTNNLEQKKKRGRKRTRNLNVIVRVIKNNILS